MKKIILFVTLFSFTSISCNSECKKSLADLTTNLVSTGISILAGTEFNIGATILNIGKTVTDCINSNAGETTSNYKVNYGESEGNFTSEEIDDNYAIPPIAAGSNHRDAVSYTHLTLPTKA